MDIKIGDKVRFNQLGIDTPNTNSSLENGWYGIGYDEVATAKGLGTGIVTRVFSSQGENFLYLDFQVPVPNNISLFSWPAKFFEKVPEEKKPEFTQEEKKLLRELVQDKLKGYQELLDKLQ